MGGGGDFDFENAREGFLGSVYLVVIRVCTGIFSLVD